MFSMFGRTGAPTKRGAPTGQRLSDASFRMQKAVSLHVLSIQITAAILRPVHMYLRNVSVH